jgi:hypothetical protein
VKVQSADRITRRLILGASAPLPRPLRVRARYRLLSRWHLATARRADVFLVRHPKAGGTWLRVLVTRLYANKYGLSSRRVVRTDELQRQLRTLPRFLSSSGYLSWERPFGEAITADPALREKKLILLARHPCDVAVSWHLQFTKRTSPFKREMLLHQMRQPIERGIGLWEFVTHPEIGLPAIIEYYNFWHRNAEQLKNAFVVRYEDLRMHTADTLEQLGGFLGESFSDAAIEDALRFGSVENLRALERANYFRNRALRLRDAEDPRTLKVRRARVGGYREDLTPEQSARMQEWVQTRLHPGLGYP